MPSFDDLWIRFDVCIYLRALNRRHVFEVIIDGATSSLHHFA